MIETARLVLRPWTEQDLPLLIGWNADPQVYRHFGRPRAADDVRARFALMRDWQDRLGFSFWAVERKADRAVIGNCGLKPLTVPWPDPADIEIGWLLAPEAWGQGYATEAAAAALATGLARAPRVIAMIARTNLPSMAVASAIGLARVPSLDFDHPDVPPGPYRPHIVYAKAVT